MKKHLCALSVRPLRFLALLALLAGSGSITSAQVPGEVLRAVKVPGSGSGGPELGLGAGYGRDVANAGDVDGDGVTDLLVGASNCSDGLPGGGTRANSGAAWLIFLNADGTARESVKYSNQTPGMPELEIGDYFGKGVDCIGDLDGDGVRDIVVGASGDDDGKLDHGALYVLFLHSDGSIKSYQKISATEGGFQPLNKQAEFGRTVCAIGDFNLDGIPDVASSRMPRGYIKSWGGAVYLIFLNQDGTVKNRRTVALSDLGLDYVTDNRFGFSLAARDLDQDGIIDLVSGDLTYDGYPIDGAINPHNGAVWCITLNADGTAKNGWIITEGMSGFTEDLDPADHFGSGVDAPELDFDGDGVFDLIVGRKRDDDHPSGNCQGTTFCPDWSTCCLDVGAAYILFMNPDNTVKGYQKISNLAGNFPWVLSQDDRFGQSVAGLGDLNGDGFPEVAIGTRWDDEAAPNAGIVYVCTISDGSVTPTKAWFTADVRTGDTPLTVAFTDATTGTDLSSWSWKFGDGATSTEQNPVHTYTTPGTFDVQLDVDGLSGFDRITRSDLIVVDADALLVDFEASPKSGARPLTVHFTDLSIGNPVTWDWDFGDGGTSTAQHPSHVYTELGTYDVTVTVTDDDLETVTLTKPTLINVGEEFRRIGCDPLAANTITVQAGAPNIGSSIVFGIDNPYGTQPAGSITYLKFAFSPQPNYPCGNIRPNYGMAFPGASGEIVIGVIPPPKTRPGTPFGGPGNPGLSTLAIPNNIGLIGATMYAQGMIVDPSASLGVQIAVTDGLEFTLR